MRINGSSSMTITLTTPPQPYRYISLEDPDASDSTSEYALLYPKKSFRGEVKRDFLPQMLKFDILYVVSMGIVS
jgi:hypothetical protein